MAAQKKSRQINLIPKEEFETSTVGRILKWLLGTFRFIVIFTEMIVMMAFLSRFWLDAQSNDLNEEIKEKQVLIASYAPLEKEFRDVQKRLQTFTETLTASTKSQDSASITSLIPSDVQFESFSTTRNEVKIMAISFSERSISQFIANLEASGKFSEVSLGEINTKKGDGAISFVISLKLISSKLKT